MQRGIIYQGPSKSGSGNWYMRYYEPVLDGTNKTRRACVKLADYGGKYKTAESVRPLADQILAPINVKTAPVESVMTVASFFEHVFLTERVKELKPATAQTYREVFRRMKPFLGEVTLRDFRTSDAARIFKAMSTKENGEVRAHGYLRYSKSILSAVFRYARETDRITHNPITDARFPKGSQPDTYAYSLDEIKAMLKVLTGTPRALVAVAAFSGLRISEIRGLQWADLDGDAIQVRRAVWNGHIGEPKREASSAAVPMLPMLKKELDAHRKRNPGTTWVFQSTTGRPLHTLNCMFKIRKAIAKPGIPWHGWHAFRRGLATNLHDLGVDDLTIAAILRHADVSTTRQLYIKRLPQQSVDAMKKLSTAFGD